MLETYAALRIWLMLYMAAIVVVQGAIPCVVKRSATCGNQGVMLKRQNV